MLDRTHRPDAPWVLVAANSKRHARLEVLRTVVDLLS
jgi:polyphosphate kinase 2 (PPK2 family)